MILVTKEEAKKLRGMVDGIVITRTMRQKSKRGRFYMEETSIAKKALSLLRNKNIDETEGFKVII